MSDGHDDAYQDGYRAGLVVAEETIVEWLEGLDSDFASLPPKAIASAIKRGDHNKTKP